MLALSPHRRWRTVVRTATQVACATAILASISGCASFTPDGGFAPVADTARERLGKEAAWARTDAEREAVRQRTAELLAAPLDADAAVQVALLNSPALQVAYASLGISEANYVQATRIANPGFSFSRTTAGDTLNIERTLTVGLMNMLALPVAARIEQARFGQTRLLVADTLLRQAHATRRAWIEAVAADQSLRYAEQVRHAAETGALFARDLARAGNLSKLDHAREHAFYADAATRVAVARQRAISAREQLTRQMGLWNGDLRYQLPQRLPDLPTAGPLPADLEGYAVASRLDLQAARVELDSLAASLGLTRATRFVSVLDVAWQHNNETGSPRETGYEIGIEIPLFDWGGARVARAEAVYMQSANRLAAAAIQARSEVRERHAGYQVRYDVARHYRDEVVPLRKRISDEALLRYNGMLISVFELLSDARDQIGAVNGYLDALRDYWLAQADLAAALGGRLPEGEGNVVRPVVSPRPGPTMANGPGRP